MPFLPLLLLWGQASDWRWQRNYEYASWKKIGVESTVGGGTKFILSLPLRNRHFVVMKKMTVTEGRESLIDFKASVSSYGQLMAEEIKEP